MKKIRYRFRNSLTTGKIKILIGIYVFLRIVANKYSESKEIDMDNPYLRTIIEIKYKGTIITRKKFSFYIDLVKPLMDKMISFFCLVILLPLYVIISIAIYCDDPGPIFFTQKRVGKDRHFFKLHKFRSMYISAPHNVPTHKLNNPDKYITRVGQVLRKTSLDELPQIWDIFRGKMSIVGPRPALWNQSDLIAEREKWNANGILPGLTGWAQIHGRDELKISDKAKLDGEYAIRIQRGGLSAFILDIKCILNTIHAVISGDGIVEGEQ